MTDTPPESTQRELAALRATLDEQVPAKASGQNLLIGTWNIREFGGLTEKWRSTDADVPKRDLHSLHCIAEMVSRFDVVAIQEAQTNLKALRHMLELLAPHWTVILTDATKDDMGQNERLAFVFDQRRVSVSGLACELVVPFNWKEKIPRPDALDRQFARTPYAVSFLSEGQTFILVALHIWYGDKPEDRLTELRYIAAWLAEMASDVYGWHHNLIALGDFNIDRRGDPNYEAFVSAGLRTPPELDDTPRTIFHETTGAKFYDQIAWFTGESEVPKLSLAYTGRAGYVDWTADVLTSLDNVAKSYRISDHFLLWSEFDVRDG